MKNEFSSRLSEYQRIIEAYLDTFFQDHDPQKSLYEAMRYSLLAGGKRIRPVLVLEFCRVCGGVWERALPFAAAVEMVHTYSLIHDDLPAMDNDDYRRGKLTNHKVYGEAQAILAGDALLTAAFNTVASAEAEPETALKIVKILAACAGEKGMVGGQVLDIEGEKKLLDEAGIRAIHTRKTGALIEAACTIGAAAAGANDEKMAAAAQYAQAIGLAFQIRDDMLDAWGDEEKLGKATQADGNKNTFATLYNKEQCQALIEQENKKAIVALDVFEDHVFLVQLAEMLAGREH